MRPSLPDELNTFYAHFEAHNTAPHRVRSHGCCRRGESTLPFCRGCNSILQTGEHPQSCGPGWHPRPCAQSMRLPTSRGFYRHLQSVPLSVCGSLMLQKIHHCTIPKKNKITCLNDWRPVALTPIFSKCFEKLIRDHICSVLPASLDPLQFAYRRNRSTDDAYCLHPAHCSLPPGK